MTASSESPASAASGGVQAAIGARDVKQSAVKAAFANVTESDYVRDALSLLLLCLALTMDGAVGRAGDNGIYKLTVLVAALALLLPYLARFSVLPKGWTVAKTRATRIVLALPFLGYVLWAGVVKDIVTDGPIGLAPGIAIAGAGVALAAQARSSELGPVEVDRGAGATARLFAQLTALLMMAGYVGTLIFILISDDYSADGKTSALLVVLLVTGAALSLIPAGATLVRNTAAWRSFSVGLGIVIVALLYFTRDGSGSVWSIETYRLLSMSGFDQSSGGGQLAPLALGLGIGAFFFPAFAAIVSSPAFKRHTARNSALEERLDLAAIVLRMIACVAALYLIAIAAYLILLDSVSRGYIDSFTSDSIAAIVVCAIVVVVAVFALRSFGRDPGASRPAIIIALATSLVGGFVLGSVSPFDSMDFGKLLLALGLPAIGAYALIGNSASRNYFAQSAHHRPGPRPQAYEWSAPVAAPAPVHQTVQPTQPVQPIVVSAPATVSVSSASPELAVPVTRRAVAENSTAPAPVTSGHRQETAVIDDLPDEATVAKYAPPVADVVTDVAAGEASTTAEAASEQVPHSIEDTNVDSQATQVIAQQSGPESASEGTQVLEAVAPASHGFTEAQALDPLTPALTLAKIAEVAPELRPSLALNPATYPALIEWLGQIGDPAINAALARREQS